MNPILKSYLGAAALAATLIAQPTQAGIFGDEKTLHLVVIETAKLYTEDEEKVFDHAKLAVFRELVADAEYQSDTTYEIILTSKPNASLFRGSAVQLAEQGRTVLDAVKIQPTCNGLAAAWAQAERTIALEEPEKIFVTTIGPAIDTGLNCQNAGTITLPKAFPQQMALATILADSRTESFHSYMTHGDQVQMLIDHAGTLGGWDRKRAGDLDVRILSLNPTITALGLGQALR